MSASERLRATQIDYDRISCERFLLEFSERGLTTFVALFPWTFFFLFVVLLIAFGLLMRRFTSAYRFPFLRVFLWILVIGITGSTLIELTPFHAFRPHLTLLK